ncbi:MAG: hypothetical protein CL920_23455 [Deltaproteobacteria bacterium]|nr:hypothetical protein [Deltaproteobacteria bacterium]MBU51658.1 hypothetical protein [Deltaproteobacteria bacterium]
MAGIIANTYHHRQLREEHAVYLFSRVEEVHSMFSMFERGCNSKHLKSQVGLSQPLQYVIQSNFQEWKGP